MDRLRRDLALALRGLTRQPGFAAVAIFTLALGIGANAAIFTVLNALVLRPLPYPEPDRLVTMVSDRLEASNIEEWRDAMPAMEALAGYTIGSSIVTDAGPARTVRAMTITNGFFDILGAHAVRGRLFAKPDHAGGAAPVAVVSPALAESLGMDDGPPDGAVTYDGTTYDVVGVLPADFSLLRYDRVDLWLPRAGSAAGRVSAIGRLARGATPEQAMAEAAGFARRLDPDASDPPRLLRVMPLTDAVYSDVRSPLLVLFGASALVLLIACVNVANLLLSKATARSTELSVRAALGASRVDLVRQLLTENAVLAFWGAVTGLLVASWTVDLLTGLAPAYTPRLDEIGIDGTVLGFTLGIALLVTLAAGLAPALTSSRASIASATGRRAATDSSPAMKGRSALVSAELALALVVVVASGLLLRTFMTLRPVSPGFETEDRIVARLRLPSADAAYVSDVAARVVRAIDALPGAPRAALATDMPLTGESMLFPVVSVDGRRIAEGGPVLHFRAVTPDYMPTIGMPLLRGRGLSPADRAGAPATIVVNENTARRLWPDGDAVGHRVAFDLPDGETEFTVVGVSGDALLFGMTTGSRPEVFASLAQSPWARLRLVVHSPGANLDEQRLREIIATVDPRAALEEVTPFDALAAASVAPARFQMALMTLFGTLAFTLAIIGCYGVLSFNVARRHREIGVRIALGATRTDILRHLVGGGLPPILAGLGAGIIGAWAATRVLGSILYGVEPTDPTTFALSTAALLLTAVAAALLPARKAAALQPLDVLRSD